MIKNFDHRFLAEAGDEVEPHGDPVFAEGHLAVSFIGFVPPPVHGRHRDGFEALGQCGTPMLLHIAVPLEQLAGADVGFNCVAMPSVISAGRWLASAKSQSACRV